MPQPAVTLTPVSRNPIDAYLAAQPEPQRSTLQVMRRQILEVIPDAEECLSYGIPGFRFRGKVIAGIAGYAHHVSYFPHSGKVLPALADLLEDYDWGAGTLRVPVDSPLPQELTEALIAEKLRQAFGDAQS